MNKEQFKLQVEQNKYMRGVAVSVCKIFLWSGLYAFAVWVVMSIAAKIATDEVAKTSVTSLSKGTSSDGGVPLVFASVLIILFSIILGILVYFEVISKIKEHKRISDLEDKYFGITTLNDDSKIDVEDDGIKNDKKCHSEEETEEDI